MSGKLSELGASVMNLFTNAGGASTQNNSNQLTSPVTAPPTTITATPTNDGKLPTGEAELAAVKAAAKTPLTDFVDLFKVEEIDPSKKPLVEPDPLNFDPSKLSEISRNIDFTKGVPPDLLAKAKGGDMDAMMQVMQLSTQNSFAQGIHAMSGVAKKALDKQARDLAKSMPETVRASATAASLREANPLYSDPAFAPIVDTLSQQLRTKHPDATPKQITEHVNTYLDGVAQMFKTGKSTSEVRAAKTKAGTDDVDWFNFMEGKETSSS